MIYGTELFLLILCAGVAYWQSRLIKANDPIYHGLWGFLYAIFIAAGALISYPFPDWESAAKYAVVQGFGHLPVFNFLLNIFRGKAWNYVSTDTGSILDRLQYDLFGAKAWIFWIVCFVIFIALQFWL